MMASRLPEPPLTIVTGAGGWFGRAFIAALCGRDDPEFTRSGSIRALVHSASEARDVLELSDRVQVHVGDVCEPLVLEHLFAGAAGADVVHAAGVIHPRRVADFCVNSRGTQAVISAAGASGVRRFVHISSNSPFGVNATPSDTFRGNEPYRPYMGYGFSKMEGEIAVKDAVAEDSIDAVIVRPPWFYGPYQPERQTSFFRLVRRGLFPVFGRGDSRRSMVFIGNLVAGVIGAELTANPTSGAYWIADPHPYSIAELLTTVKRVMRDEGLDVAHRQVRVPRIVGDVAERVDATLQRFGYYNTQLHVLGEMNKTIACDISMAQVELGYAPRVELEEGMRRSIRWCIANGIAL